MNDRLLDITNRLQALRADEDKIDPEAFRDTMEGLEGEFEDKVIRCIHVRDQYLAQAQLMAKKLDAYRKRLETVMESAKYLEAYVFAEMLAAKVYEVDSPQMVLKLRSYPQVEVVNQEEIPTQLMTVKPPVTTVPPPAPDKKAILKQLKDGETVPGCLLDPNYKLQIKYPKLEEETDGES